MDGKVVKLAIGNVSFDLLIPQVCKKLLEPLVKSNPVRLRQPHYLRFQFLNAHGGN
jgi:hypothetical protein